MSPAEHTEPGAAVPAGASELCLSEDVYRGVGVAELLDGAPVTPEAGIRKALADEIALYRAALG